jgi:hypothetical protein
MPNARVANVASERQATRYGDPILSAGMALDASWPVAVPVVFLALVASRVELASNRSTTCKTPPPSSRISERIILALLFDASDETTYVPVEFVKKVMPLPEDMKSFAEGLNPVE